VENEQQASQAARDGGQMQITQYFSAEVMKPIFIATSLQFFLQVCGVVPIVCYAVDVFKAAGTEGVHENVSTIVLGVFNLVRVPNIQYWGKYACNISNTIKELFLCSLLLAWLQCSWTNKGEDRCS